MNANLSADTVRQTVLSLPQMAAWPEVVSLFVPKSEYIRMDWQLPARAARAVGSSEIAALPAVAAIACLQISIILADDMLDQDPRGEHHRLGEGRTANLALAFQAAALALVNQAPVDPEHRALAGAALANAALGTAYGQELDVSNLQGEANYWRVVKAKSTPFYGAAFQIGALLGCADPVVAQRLYDTGVLLGEMIQVFDDLEDAFAAPANPDWSEGRNNLAILYAGTVNHPQRDRLGELRGTVADAENLRAAQKILVSSGAVSYCVYLLIQRYQTARRLVLDLHLPDPAPILEVVDLQIVPLTSWLENLGLPVPPELLGKAA